MSAAIALPICGTLFWWFAELTRRSTPTLSRRAAAVAVGRRQMGRPVCARGAAMLTLWS